MRTIQVEWVRAAFVRQPPLGETKKGLYVSHALSVASRWTCIACGMTFAEDDLTPTDVVQALGSVVSKITVPGCPNCWATELLEVQRHSEA
jgi:hypothetical protein